MTNTEFEGDGPEVAFEGGDDGAHMDTFRAPEIEDEGGAAPDDVRPVGDDGEPIGIAPDQITKEAFWTVWNQSFSLPGLFSARWKPLAIQPDEADAGRAASDAIYEILEIYWPAVLSPAGDMAARLAACIPFLLAKVTIARMIVGEMRAERIAAQQPANRNAPPGAAFKSQRGGGQPGPMSWMDAEQEAAA